MTISTTPAKRTRNRPSLAKDDLDLARQIGTRLKAARLRAGLTQRELAEPRYTKAYISALENGLIKPSMAALRFLARKLGTVPSAFLADEDTAWERVEAELRLAAGDWQTASDRFRAILDSGVAGVGRGLTLLGLAEASYRLGRGHDTIAQAAEAVELLSAAKRLTEARRASYWLSAGHSLADDPVRARILLEQILAETRPDEDPELRVRILVALAGINSYSGEIQTAIGLLEEARAIGADLDDRRRATMLYSLAQSYRLAGDLEGAIRTAIESLALFRAVDARRETASIENELAMTFLGIGNLDAAREHAGAARQAMESEHNDLGLAHLTDTEARIALARGDLDAAGRQAAQAAELAERVGNAKALVDALLTQARVARHRGDTAAAVASLERAASAAGDGPDARMRVVLTEWSEVLAERGDHAGAYELSKRALALG
jgi:transcriptional regulator with XRE-family HTH domain